MAIQTSSTAANSVLTRYRKTYEDAVDYVRTYDQFAYVVKETDTFEPRGTTISFIARTDLQPRPTTAIQSQTADFDPQTFADKTATMTVDYYADGLKMHEKASIASFTDLGQEAAHAVGVNEMETIDALARRVCTEGNLVFYGGTATARTGLHAEVAAERTTQALFNKVASITGFWQTNRFVDGSIFCVMDDFCFNDLINESSAPAAVLTYATHVEAGKQILLNREMAKLASIRIVVSPYSKNFYGSGAVSAVGTHSSTLNGAVTAGATTLTLTSSANLTAGDWLTIGTPQATTETDANLLNEICYVTSAAGTTIIGQGRFNGLKYDHATLAVTKNNSTAHSIVFGGPKSIAKAFSKELSEYGQMVPPFETGNAKQWTTWSWKWYGGYALIAQGNLIRAEVSASQM